MYFSLPFTFSIDFDSRSVERNNPWLPGQCHFQFGRQSLCSFTNCGIGGYLKPSIDLLKYRFSKSLKSPITKIESNFDDNKKLDESIGILFGSLGQFYDES